MTALAPQMDSASNRKLLWVLFFVHCLLSWFFIHMDTTINNDGILYLRTAETLSTQGLSAALGLYRWPFYTMLIAFVQTVTHLSYVHAAYIVNFSLQAALFFVFIRLVSMLSVDRRVPIVAALVLIGFAYLNDYRAMILRDFGYWVAILLSVIYWCKACERLAWQPIVLALVSAAVAFLFRVEGIVFLAFGPVALLFSAQSLGTRMRYFAATVLAGITLLVLALASLVYIRGSASSIGLMHLLQAPLSIKQQFVSGRTSFSEGVLNYYSQKYAGVMLAGGLATLYLLKIIKLVNPVQSYLFLANICQRCRQGLSVPAKIVLWYIVLNVVVTSVFLTQAFFISSRYMMTMALLILAFVPAQLLKMYDRWRLGPNTRFMQSAWFPLIVLYCIYAFSASVVGAFESKRYINDAAMWLREHVPPSAKLYSNERHILYVANKQSDYQARYFDHQHEFEAVLQGQWRHYDYIALRVRPKSDAALKQFRREYPELPIKIFADKSGNRVLIFKTQ